MAYSCDDCGQWFDRPAKLEAHERSHSGERPFACERRGCDKRFFRAEHLQRHEQAHDGIKNIRCTSGDCPMLFRLQHHMKAHLKTHGPMPYQCDAEGCEAEFKKKNQLKKHEVSHTGIMPFPCKTEGCGKGFMLQSQLRTHSKRHTTVYTCDAEGCTRTFDKWSLLVTHRKSHRTLVCQKCNKIFLRPEGLKAHEKLHDPNRQQFPCTWEGCAKQYSRASNLKTHVRAAHEKNKRFKCDVANCGAAFSHKKSLVTHGSKGHTASGRPLSHNNRRSSLASLLTGIPDEPNGNPTKLLILPVTEEEESGDHDSGQGPPPAPLGMAAFSLFGTATAAIPLELSAIEIPGSVGAACGRGVGSSSGIVGRDTLPLHTPVTSQQMEDEEDGRSIPLDWNDVGTASIPPVTHPAINCNEVLFHRSFRPPDSFAPAAL